MNDWYASVFKGFMFASVISFIISLFTSGKTSYGAELSGYSTIILAIFLILLIMFQNKSIVSSSCFILLLAVIGFIMYSVITYKDNIINDHVAPYFKTFTSISILLIMIQTYVMYSSIFNDNFDKTHTISKVNTYLLYLLSIITFICSLIIFIILKYYTTDG
jgi:hypothetical protein